MIRMENAFAGRARVQWVNMERCSVPSPEAGHLMTTTITSDAGLGNRLKDDLGRVRCSKVQGGDISIDEYGKVKCEGGCEAGKRSRCEEAR